MLPEYIPVYILLLLMVASFIAGFIDSIAGGGGLIILPINLATGMPAHLALGTGKLIATSGTLFSLAIFSKGKMVAWKVVAYGVPFSLLGSVAGANLAMALDPATLGKILILLLPFGAALTLCPKRKQTVTEELSNKSLAARTILVCLFMGIYDGFFGPGTGSILLIALHTFLRLDLVKSSGTTKAFNSASNVGALVTFLFSGQLLYSVGIPMALANIGGNILGSRLAMSQGSGLVQKMLLVSLVLLFSFLVCRYFFNLV